jgi:hypothetical protein
VPRFQRALRRLWLFEDWMSLVHRSRSFGCCAWTLGGSVRPSRVLAMRRMNEILEFIRSSLRNSGVKFDSKEKWDSWSSWGLTSPGGFDRFIRPSQCGGMVDAMDSKSIWGDSVPVQVRPLVLAKARRNPGFRSFWASDMSGHEMTLKTLIWAKRGHKEGASFSCFGALVSQVESRSSHQYRRMRQPPVDFKGLTSTR